MRKTRNSLADSKSSGSGSEERDNLPTFDDELTSTQCSSGSVKSQGDTSSEEPENVEWSNSGSGTNTSESENNSSLEHKNDELFEPNNNSLDMGKKNKKPIPKPRKHIQRKDSSSGIAKNEVHVLGVNLRQTSTLKFKKFLRGPRVRISIFDQSTGQLAKKSKPGLNVVLNNEPETLDYILPIISTQGKMSSEVSFSWNEVIILNDAVEHLLETHFIMFFEIIDVVTNPMKHMKHKKVQDGWYHACWAFIRLSSQSKTTFGENLHLQLYKYQNLAENHPIFQQWSLPNLQKYPGILDINFTSILPKCESIGLLRPFTALESDKTQPILPSNNPIENEASEDLAPSTWIKTFEIIRRRSFEPPIKKIFECVTAGSSTVCRFSPDGRCVAYADNVAKSPTIFVKYIHNLNSSLTLKGHTNIIHSLEWHSVENENHGLLLISTSEDQSCIVWRVEENSYMLQHVLPHPCFLYCSIYVSPGKDKNKSQIITGGRDCIIRIWDISSANVRMLQQIQQHENYIVGMAYNSGLHAFLSADNQGKIIEWGYNGSKLKWENKREFNIKSAIKQFYLHPLATNAYVLSERSLVKIDLNSGTMQWPLKNFIGSLDIEKFAISESGANIFLATNSEVICIHQFSEEVLCKIRLKRYPGRTNCIEFCSQRNFLAVSMRNNIFGGEFLLFGPEEKVEDIEVQTGSKTNVQHYKSNSDGPLLRNSTFNEILNKLEDILKVKRDNTVERKTLLKQKLKDEEENEISKSDKSDNLTYSIQRSGTFTIDKDSKEDDREGKNTFTVNLKSGTDDNDDTDASMDLQSSGRKPITQRSNRTVIYCKEFESNKKE